jgi:hypothetical protein
MSQDNQRQATLYAYLAGIIDGEGTIRIGATKPNSKNPLWNIRYYAAISVGMSEKKVIEKFEQTFGTNTNMYVECIPNRKTMYRWGTSGTQNMIDIIKKLLPYLIAKREQAKLVLKFCENKKVDGFRRNKGLPKKELQRREEIYLKVKKLNAVGAAATTKQNDTREGEAIV